MLQVCWIPIFKAKKLILAGDPMQLPPTVLSLNNRRKKKGSVAAKLPKKKTAAAKTGLGPSEKPAASGPPPVQVPQDDDHEAGSSNESDEGGDTVMKDDDSVPFLDETEPEISATGGTNPPVVKALRRGALEPPRTLETTLFDRLEKMYGPGIKRLLNVQYRCGGYFLELLVR
jgi:DNA polymerase alpha-associated DNA helicase A